MGYYRGNSCVFNSRAYYRKRAEQINPAWVLNGMLAAIPAPWSGVKAGYVNNKIPYRGEPRSLLRGSSTFYFRDCKFYRKLQEGRQKGLKEKRKVEPV